MTDERALLAAIVADPADDTVRLAYADCIEERGNAARAAFIRLQIEAEGLHPNSNARARLAAQAEALFAEHWIDWWGEVCAAVGLPLPAPKVTGTLGRLARWARLAAAAGEPFAIQGTTVLFRGQVYDMRLGGWSGVDFRRGFPDAVDGSFPYTTYHGKYLRLWPGVSPLRRLVATAPQPETWPDGPHLAGVESLELFLYDPPVLHDALRSPHLNRLRELILRPVNYGNGEAEAFAEELPAALAEPRVRQLERLSVPLYTTRAAGAVANAPNLAGLHALYLCTPIEADVERTAAACLTTLAHSPHLTGLRELVVTSVDDAETLRAVTYGVAWKCLRKLSVANWEVLPDDAWAALLCGIPFPELEELHLGAFHLERATLGLLVGSPLLKRLRHLSLVARNTDALSEADVCRLADIVDPERIETFAFYPDHRTPALEELRKRFGDRLRMG